MQNASNKGLAQAVSCVAFAGRTGGRDDELFGRQCGGCASLRRQ